MELRGRETEISPTERTIPNDPEKTIVAPRFDEKSVQGARPAVPLNWRGRTRTSLPVILLCVAAGLLGGLVVVFAFTLWQRNSSNPRAETTAAQQQTGGAANSATSESSAPTVPTPQQVEPDARGTQGDVQTPAAQNPAAQNQVTQASEPDGAHPTETDGSARDAARAAPAAAAQAPPKSGDEVAVGEAVGDAGTQNDLRAALGEWIAATNARDINRQMQFYAPTLGAFYLARNASRESVRAEKARVFANASTVDVHASAPEISLSRDGQTAVMRFQKRYRIGERGGEVLQELRWRRTPAGWKIVGERDLRVLQ
jgi:ketosteroid isomerase-like protein